MPPEQISQLVGFEFHRGMLACGLRKTMRGLEAFQRTLTQETDSRLSLGLFGISEQENMGSILRTAAGLGVNRVLIGPRTIDPFSRRVIRVSMGNVFKVNFFRLDNPTADLLEMQNSGVQTIASSLDDGSEDVRCVRTQSSETLLLIGNEASGIEDEIQRIVDLKVRISMMNDVDSLNAAPAAAILMYHFSQ